MGHRLFFDLDGVLADFDAGCVDLFGMGPKDFIEINGELVFWKRLAEADGFYAGLRWMDGARDMVVEAIGLVRAGGDVPMVLTGLPLGDWAAPQKRAWVEARLPDVPVICCLSKDKPTYGNPGDVLIDDREEARVGWEAIGGEFYHHTSSANTLAWIRSRYAR